MAGRLAFHYFPGRSLLHRWDARCKFLGLLVLTIGFLHMGTLALTLFSALFAVALTIGGLPWRALLKELTGWLFFLGIIFLLQAFFYPGSEPPLFSWLPLSSKGLHLAVLTCWRLLLILCYATVFTFVTRPKDLQDAIVWFLNPFPFVPARRIAFMMTLTLRFLPLILDQAEEVGMAGRSRLSNQRKNPILRAKYFVLPLFRRSLIRADELALALAARGYREDLPVHLPGIPKGHLMALFLLLLGVLLCSQGIAEHVMKMVKTLI
ncbi:energy-coupling factor transporter transmembrane component T family protein [Desulforhabdus amnigena]|nr:energy-coupling factor transporter transmembrane component T [Desulforhabdus amnigena]